MARFAFFRKTIRPRQKFATIEGEPAFVEGRRRRVIARRAAPRRSEGSARSSALSAPPEQTAEEPSPGRSARRLRPTLGEKGGDIRAHAYSVRMIRPEACLTDRQRAAHERLGLGEAVRRLEQFREIVEVPRHVWMMRPVARLVDRERAAKEGLGLGEAVHGLEQTREIVEALIATSG